MLRSTHGGAPGARAPGHSEALRRESGEHEGSRRVRSGRSTRLTPERMPELGRAANGRGERVLPVRAEAPAGARVAERLSLHRDAARVTAGTDGSAPSTPRGGAVGVAELRCRSTAAPGGVGDVMSVTYQAEVRLAPPRSTIAIVGRKGTGIGRSSVPAKPG